VKLLGLAVKNCDILFLPGAGTANGFKPYVTMSQNLLPFEKTERARYRVSPTFFRLLLLRYQQARSFRNADGILFLSDYARSKVISQIGNLKGRARVVPHGVNTGFRCLPREQKPIRAYSKEHPFRFLYVSIVNLYKHQWHVAEAIKELKKEGYPVTLELIGPAYPPALRRLQNLLNQIDPEREFIYYRGPLHYKSLPRPYAQADGFVFASSCENLPSILIEAMAAGLPIACSNRGPMPEILGEAGVYFDPENPSEIAAALRCLIEHADMRERCAHLAYSRSLDYSWSRCARETFSFLAEVARGNGAPTKP
jgi:glycosyltransferase involved in cell wall biosynthesis